MPNPCPLTQKTVDDLRYEGARQTIRDGASRGLMVRVAQGGNTYALQREYEGRTRLFTLGSTSTHTLKQARQWATATHVLLDKGIDPAAPPPAPAEIPSLGRAWAAREEWLALHRRPATVENHRVFWKFFTDWADRQITTISREMLLTRRNALAEHPVQANRAMKAFRETWNWTSDVLVELPECPMPKRYFMLPEQSKPKGLNPAELSAWADRIADHPREQMYLFGLFSGLRRRTMLDLQWDWIGWQRIEIPGEAMKSGRSFDLPLSTQLYLILGRVPRLDPVRIFPFAGTRSKSFTHGHALRHTYRTQGAAAGVPTAFLDALMDHRAAALGSVYQNDAALFDALLKEQQRVSDRLAEFVEV